MVMVRFAKVRRGYRRGSGKSDAPDEAQDKDEQGGADGRGNDRSDDPAADMDVQDARQPAADEGAYNPDDDVADQAEAAALDQRSGQPPGDRADENPYNKTMCVD